MKYAVIAISGSQVKVSEGETFVVDRMQRDVGSQFVLPSIYASGQLLVNIQLRVISHDLQRKCIVFHKRRRHNSVKKQGFRHSVTQLQVEKITEVNKDGTA